MSAVRARMHSFAVVCGLLGVLVAGWSLVEFMRGWGGHDSCDPVTSAIARQTDAAADSGAEFRNAIAMHIGAFECLGDRAASAPGGPSRPSDRPSAAGE
jgi:hypothetical protein